jgi:PAS domain S-box-containing protein
MVDAGGRIVLVNREVERLFGYSREELFGQEVERLVPLRQRDRHPEFRTVFLANPRARSMGAGRELYGLRKDGTEVPVEIGLNPIATEDGLFVLAAVVDISERQRAERERRSLEDRLQHSRKLEALGRMASGVAHDFNNILAVIEGYTELVRDALPERLDQLRNIDDVLQAAARGKELVGRILRFSQPQPVESRPVDMCRAVEDGSRLPRAVLPAGIEIQLDLDAPPFALTNASSVNSALMNLATNAAHAMPQGGALGIRLEPFYAHDHFARAHPNLREGHYVKLTVSDTGTGMNEEEKLRAFEPFFTTEPGSGSGLGLSLVHGILRDNGGTVWLDSKIGAGTCVHCLFPAVESLAVESRSGEEERPAGHGQRILFVEDEAALARLGGLRLTRLGYSVTIATDPIEALRSFVAAPDEFDVVVTDFSMPRMDGLTLAREIARVRPAVPIIVLSGNADDHRSAEMGAAGVRTVLLKPVTTSELAVALRNVLERA